MNSQSSPSTTRGSIIKVPDTTPGILLANGQQQQFTLDQVWKSAVAPAVNMMVDIEMDGTGVIRGLTVVDQHQLNKERMNQIGGIAQERGKELAKTGKEAVGVLANRMGVVPFGSAVVFVIALFFLPAAGVSISLGVLGGAGSSVSWTFWNLLGISFGNPQSVLGGAAASGFGFLNLLALLAAAPFAAPYIKAAWTRYLNAAPLAIVILGFLSTWMGERKAFGQLSQVGIGNPFSWSWGFYILALAALVLAAPVLKAASQK